MINTKKFLYGVGVNDVGYNVKKQVTVGYENGKQIQKQVWICPYYAKWKNMLQRCYDTLYQSKYPTYIGCTVCEEWKYLSKFIKWVDSQPNRDWENCQLDKDILMGGTKHYSPITAVFISVALNNFVINRGRGGSLLGVCYKPYSNKIKPYEVKCSNPFNSDNEYGRYLGTFSTELEAHLVWKAKKHEYACIFAEQQDDPRVADALRKRYAPDTDWSKA